MRTIGKISAGSVAVVLFAVANVARAQNAPTDENGRYTLSATDNGYLRLDTRTGAVSICTSKGGWTCRVVPDERVALDQEIGRLQTQIATLKTQLESRNDTVKGKIDEPLSKKEALKKGDSLQTDVPEKPVAGDGSVSSQDKLAVALDHIWRHLVEIAARVQKKISENI